MDPREVLDKKVDAFRRRYAETMSDLGKERERLEWLAEALEVPLPPLPKLPKPDEEETTTKAGPVAVKAGQFFSMSQTDAASAYLKLVHRACTIDELIDGLQRGGIVFNGKDPKAVLYTQLVRATFRFVKLPTGEFGLLDWYPKEKAKRHTPRKTRDSAGTGPTVDEAAAEDEVDESEPETDETDETDAGSEAEGETDQEPADKRDKTTKTAKKAGAS